MTLKKAVFVCDICQSGTCSLSLNECGIEPEVCPFDNTYKADWVKQESPVIKQSLTTEKEFCEWKKTNKHDGMSHPSCSDGKHMNYGFNFCPYCGKPIKIKE